ncbi:ubiquinone biosynthesis monooxygenase COQ6, mitochondrial-like [Dendronephthya gigantea]|uniref:ubiquinone biosynthesis monooxygenase COQ6, mitochondrial-like n=1 Tax=Dendronephthya gigantea TaxID=151771 RepID=UPI00106A1639|nr:ubiquinone biosynthesis monooxygenase COQ6, mitochondrial-like [Dendronephthya gigantea]
MVPRSIGILLRKISGRASIGKAWFTTQQSHNSKFYDAIIVGGGMVGSTLACAIGGDTIFQNKKVLVLEAGPQVKLKELPELYSNRVSTVSPGSKKLLERVGAWKHIENMRVKPFQRMQVWDACGDGYLTFEASDDLEQAINMAYLVENNVLITALEMELENLRSNVDVLYQTKMNTFRIPSPDTNDVDSPWAEITLEDGQEFSTRLLVGADGFNSQVRKNSGIDSISHDYRQSGVVATLCFSEPTKNIVAWQRFLPTGPIAILPLTDSKSSLVWSTTTSHAKNLVSLPEERFVDAVNEALTDDISKNSLSEMASNLLHNVLSMVQPDYLGLQIPPRIAGIEKNSRASFPLGVNHSSYYVKPRMALIGDAAHRIHPLAGQGVNLGFGDVECLWNELRQAAIDGQDLGSLEHLLRYETARQKDVAVLMGVTHGLNTLFSTSFLPFVIARNLGIQMTNVMTPVKKQIMDYAMK